MPCVCRKTITPPQHNPEVIYAEDVWTRGKKQHPAASYQYEYWWQVVDLNHEHSHSRSRLRRKSKFSSSPGREAVLRALCWHPKHCPCLLVSVQGAWSATQLLFALCRPSMYCCSWAVSHSFWRIWRAHGTPLLLTSIHEHAGGISPEHLLSLVPQSTVGWVTEQIYLNSLFPRSYFSKEGNKSMTGKVLTRQKLGSSMT